MIIHKRSKVKAHKNLQICKIIVAFLSLFTRSFINFNKNFLIIAKINALHHETTQYLDKTNTTQ
ncbi:MAG TPA: hypothetical protein DDY77_06165 [Clostridiales bacterium]|nr:hypothetical protein [Clostridiales bacterium]